LGLIGCLIWTKKHSTLEVMKQSQYTNIIIPKPGQISYVCSSAFPLSVARLSQKVITKDGTEALDLVYVGAEDSFGHSSDDGFLCRWQFELLFKRQFLKF
jgi:hypothetical protein